MLAWWAVRSLTWFIILQSALSIGLVVLLWLLHFRLGRGPFFKWWAWSWATFALYLSLGMQAQPLSAEWTGWTALLVVMATVAGYLQPVLLAFGALSLRAPALPDAFWRNAGLALGVVGGIAVFSASLQFADPIESFCIRLAPRAWALAAASVFAAVVFLRRGPRSTAGVATAVACLLFTLVQSAYGLAATGRVVVGETAPLAGIFAADVTMRSTLFVSDLVIGFGICLGLVLLLVEEHQRSIRALEESLQQRREALEQNAVLQAEIGERRRMEKALRLSEAKFAAAFRANPCSVAISRLEDGKILEVNDGCEQQTGHLRADVIGRTPQELDLWVDPSVRTAIVAELKAGGKIANREVRWRSKSGRELTILFSADTIVMDDEPCLLSVAMNVTEHKQVEARHQAILRALPDWIFLTSRQGVFLDCHVKNRRHLLAEPETFIGRTLHDVLPPSLADDLARLGERVATTDTAGTLEYSVPIDGDLRYYEVRAVRCDGDRILSIVRDQTDAKRAELNVNELRRELAHIARVTTVSAMAGSLAHEICQPLTGMRTTAQAALRLLGPSDLQLTQVREALGDIIADSDRATAVIERLRSMLRSEPARRAPVDVNYAVEEVLRLMHFDLKEKGIRLTRELQPGLPPVMGDRVQLQQVVLNLLINACEAVEMQGDGDKRVGLRTSSQGGHVTLAVIDHGVGLAQDQIGRVFEPFYTTKPEGMGLGLWICEMIAEAHDGRISVEPNDARGVTFSLRLPVLPEPVRGHAVEEAGSLVN
jgi:PAS domain S-box-containing protein